MTQASGRAERAQPGRLSATNLSAYSIGCEAGGFDSGGMRLLILISLTCVAGLVFVSAASAASCAGADPCPWSQVGMFGDVGDGEFRGPYGMDADASGNLYVVEYDNHRVQKLDSSGAFLTKWGGEGSGDGELYYPWDVAVDPASGATFVTDQGNNRVVRYDASGKFVSAWGWGVSDGSAAYQICTSGCRAGIYGAGTGQFKDPAWIATDGAHVYVADSNNARVQKFDLAGAQVGQWAIPGGQKPEGVTVAGGKVYVTTRSDTVWRFDTNGAPDNTWDGDGVTGSTGSGAGQLNDPEGIAVDGTGVYVADVTNHRISKFDTNGAFKAAWGSEGTGDGQVKWPYGVLATGGAVWVADTGNDRIQRFSQAGSHQLTVGTPPGVGEFYYPSDVAATASGDVYVADSGGRDIQRLDGSGKTLTMWGTGTGGPYSVTPTANGIYAAESVDHVSLYDSTGSLLNKFGASGSGVGQLNAPAGSAVDADGNLYVADHNNGRVQKFSPAGAWLGSLGSKGSGDGQLSGPRDVAVDSAGNVYVADGSNNRIQKFSATGAFLAKWGSAGSGDGQFARPGGLAIDGRGHVFVSDSQNDRIQEFDANGGFVAKWGTLGAGAGELANPLGLSIDSSGAVWVADNENHRIVRFCCPAVAGGAAPGSGEEPPASGGGPGPADTTAPRISLTGRHMQRTRVATRRGLSLRISTSERATLTLRALVSKRTARRLGLRRTSIARSTASLAGPGTTSLRLRMSARTRRALLRAPRVRIIVRAIAADPAGNRANASLAITARR